MRQTGRDRLLDAAEALFGQRGYSGASVREISKAACVELGLSGYHFGSKAELFRQVMRRRAPDICGALIASLDAAEHAAGDQAAGVEAILDAYVAPHIDRLASGEAGWRHYIKLGGHTAILEERDDLTAPLREYYEPVQRRYRQALRRALPGRNADQVDTAFYIFRLTVATVAGEGGWRGDPDEGAVEPDFGTMRRSLTSLFSRGFCGLEI